MKTIDFKLRNSRRIFLISSIAIFLVLLTCCNKFSSELKPFNESVTFEKNIVFKGTTKLIVNVIQTMQLGPDSLILEITNPTTTMADGLELLFYIETASDFDHTLDYKSIILIDSLAPQEMKRIKILSYPELPLTSEEVNIKLISSNTTEDNPLTGVYTGQVGFLFPSDSLEPSQYSFSKGLVEPDGNFNFWFKLDDVYKSLSGQFIDTLDMNSIYKNNSSTSGLGAVLDTMENGHNFKITSDHFKFRIKLENPITNEEDRLKFNLNK